MKRQAIMPFLAAGALTALLGTGVAQAAPPAESSAPEQAAGSQAEQTPAVKLTDAKLEKFVDAAKEVQNVQTTYTERMQQATDQE